MNIKKKVVPAQVQPVVRSLIIMNGRWKKGEHIFVAANSKADAARILKQANGGWGNFISEINVYFSMGCWGNSMKGITIERGAWVQKGNEKPIRVI